MFWLILYRYALAGWRTLRAEGVKTALSGVYLRTVRRVYNLLLATPQGRRKLQEQLSQARTELTQKLVRDKEDAVGPALGRHVALPQVGRSRQDLLQSFEQLEKIHTVSWKKGKVR